jgi:hypothetical protein
MNMSDECPSYAPSTTNPQCKVCTSPDRFEIEIALAQGQPQQHIARRFSRDGQTFSRQNIHSHYRRHMPVVEKAVAEAAAARNRGLVLDIETATEIEIQNARNRAGLRAHVSAIIERGQLDWRPRDVMAFMEFDARLGQDRSQAQLSAALRQIQVYSDAIVRVVTDDATRAKIVDTYDEMIAERGMTNEGLLGADDGDDADCPA